MEIHAKIFYYYKSSSFEVFNYDFIIYTYIADSSTLINDVIY